MGLRLKPIVVRRVSSVTLSIDPQLTAVAVLRPVHAIDDIAVLRSRPSTNRRQAMHLVYSRRELYIALRYKKQEQLLDNISRNDIMSAPR